MVRMCWGIAVHTSFRFARPEFRACPDMVKGGTVTVPPFTG
jgi:hypothetical protein